MSRRNLHPQREVRRNGARPNGGRGTVLVTGGAGFIGSHTVEALLAQGFGVRVLDDLSAGKLQNLPLDDARLEVMLGDVVDYGNCLTAMQGVRGCIHLAAQVSAARSVEQPYESATRNILGFINVLEALRECRIGRLVYASSAAVYGESQNLPLTEDEPPAPTNPYGLEKLVNERYAALYAQLHGVRSLGLRYFNVYGARQDPGSPYSGVISRFLERLSAARAPTIFGDGLQTRDFIHVSDIARANVAALAADYCGVCNVATGGRVDLLKLLGVLQRSMGLELEPEFAPERAGDIRHSCGANRRLREQLACAPQRSLKDGLHELAQQFSAPRRGRRRPHAVTPPPLAAAGLRRLAAS